MPVNALVPRAPLVKTRSRWTDALACLLALCSQGAAAADPEHPNLSLSGFGTVGLLQHDDSAFVFVRDLAQEGKDLANTAYRRDSRLGLQLNLDWSRQFGGAIQAVAREKTDFRLRNSIELAFLRFRPSHDIDVRLGRLGPDFFLISDHRNVGYAFTWVRPPVEFYGWMPFYSFDGIDVTKRFDVGNGKLSVKGYAGKSTTMVALTPDDTELKLSPFYGLSTTWENNRWRLHANHLITRFSNDYMSPMILVGALQTARSLGWSGADEFLREFSVKGARATYTSIGAVYDDSRWQIMGEYSYITSQRLSITRGDRYYLSAGYRFGAVMPYVLYAKSTDPRRHAVANPGASPFQPLWAAANEVLNDNRYRQSTTSVGVRWDVTNRSALKLQYDQIRVPADSRGFWLKRTAGPLKDGTENVLSLSYDFTF